MSVKSEMRVVYRTSAGRCYFTKRAAFIREATARLQARREKEGISDRLEGGEHVQDVFWSADQMEYFFRVAKRYYRRYKKSVRGAKEKTA